MHFYAALFCPNSHREEGKREGSGEPPDRILFTLTYSRLSVTENVSGTRGGDERKRKGSYPLFAGQPDLESPRIQAAKGGGGREGKGKAGLDAFFVGSARALDHDARRERAGNGIKRKKGNDF